MIDREGNQPFPSLLLYLADILDVNEKSEPIPYRELSSDFSSVVETTELESVTSCV